MIIVSQDKSTILNFDNAVRVYIIRDAWEKKYYCIGYSTSDRTTIILANYKTEERAKEVLQEIIERYANWNNLVYGQPTGACSSVYEMPEE